MESCQHTDRCLQYLKASNKNITGDQQILETSKMTEQNEHAETENKEVVVPQGTAQSLAPAPETTETEEEEEEGDQD